MKKHDGDLIMKFLENCDGLLSNREMIILCDGLRIANDESHDFVKNTIWFDAAGHYDKAFCKEYGAFI